MKIINRNITAALAAMFTMIGIAQESRAANLTLDGDGMYKLATKVNFSPSGGPQSGRYTNFGADYYHRATIGIQWITNRSGGASGQMSFEFWAMPFYGATSGVVLMTKGVKPLQGGGFYNSAQADGYAIYLDRYRFPEINLWEYTRFGWKHRDYLTFKSKVIL